MTSFEPAEQFAGAPDGLRRLWTPHRMAYVSGEEKPQDDTEQSCPFCRAPEVSDSDGLVVHRGETCYVVMNLFPYNSGHLLVCPYRHVGDLTDLTPTERNELAELSATAVQVLKATLGAEGMNLGMNQGEAGGAGITGHLHQHVIPRWVGDANFFPLVAQMKALPQLIEETRGQLAAAWPQGEIDAR